MCGCVAEGVLIHTYELFYLPVFMSQFSLFRYAAGIGFHVITQMSKYLLSTTPTYTRLAHLLKVKDYPLELYLICSLYKGVFRNTLVGGGLGWATEMLDSETFLTLPPS